MPLSKLSRKYHLLKKSKKRSQDPKDGGDKENQDVNSPILNLQHHNNRKQDISVIPETSSSSENGEETTDKPAFRWDGTPLVDKTKESHFLKKVKSMEVESDKNNQQPPKPPIRDSSRKREEIK